MRTASTPVLVTLLAGALFLGAGCVGSSIAIDVQVPPTIVEGEDTTMRILVRNTSGQPQVLQSISLGPGLYDGLYVNTVTPADTQTPQQPGGYTATFADVTVPARGEQEVHISLNAVWAGDYLGPVEVCTGVSVTCITQTVSMHVSPIAPPSVDQ